jgi:hypothetical protein
VIKRIGWVGHEACMGEKRYTYMTLRGEPKREIPL